MSISSLRQCFMPISTSDLKKGSLYIHHTLSSFFQLTNNKMDFGHQDYHGGERNQPIWIISTASHLAPNFVNAESA